MPTFATTLILFVLGQPQTQPDVQVIAPFVSPDVLAVLQVDLIRADVNDLAGRLAGERPASPVVGATKALLAWSGSLREAGARELYVVASMGDLPGLPLVVVPLREGTDSSAISRLFCGGDNESPPVKFPACATIHNALVAGTAAAIERARRMEPANRPELAAAFAAVSGPQNDLRLLLIPSADVRRVLEEVVPALPRELGGGPITRLTHGLLWAAAGLDSGPNPALKMIIAGSSPEAARSLQRLGQDLVSYSRNSPELQRLIPDLPQLAAQVKTEFAGDRVTVTADVQVAARLIESVTRPAREAAIDSQCTNNLKQIALGIHNHISRHKLAFPPAFITDKAGKPLLSWRVLILPYLEQEALYKEFHLDEPWDSPHNRTLIAKMPQVYVCPGESRGLSQQGKTRYAAPRGQGMVFRGAEPVKLNDITDGTSNTVMVVDAGDQHAVTWTRPDDWEVGPDVQAAAAGVFAAHHGRTADGTFIAFADGSVRFLAAKLRPATLRALLTFAGNEVISGDDL